MKINSPMTAEEFVRRKDDLPEGGRWYELHAGLPVLLTAPDDQHGTVVLNLTRELAPLAGSQPDAVFRLCMP